MPEKTTQVFVFFLLAITLLNQAAFSQDDPFPAVHEEYYHKPIFENDQIRVLNVRASKGDTTAFHRHCNPILFITLQGAQVSLQAQSGLWRTAELPTGWIGQDIYKSDSCFVHRFAVTDGGRLHIAAIEALKDTYQISPDFDPKYKAEGFSLYAMEPSNMASLTEFTIPIILIESKCQDDCVVKVVSSDKISQGLIKDYNAYAVFFERGKMNE